MPIYEYRCEACGHQDEHLQKLSEAPLSVCPACNKSSYRKQLSAAGFQLKGSGWYATDFRNSGRKPAEKSAKPEAKPEAAPEPAAKTESKPDAKPESKPASKSESKPASKSEATT
ncbi:MAG TPA: FmdB family zinc ribbon protein [Burkholderiales bacterium]|nr:FmdB family zinc ribbon protein [Burkholderiales bacterium]